MKICPMTKTDCWGNDCAWYIDLSTLPPEGGVGGQCAMETIARQLASINFQIVDSSYTEEELDAMGRPK